MEGDVRVGMTSDSIELAAHNLKVFRIRWLRWLGQKCRVDKPHWTLLLDSNWLGWAVNVGSNIVLLKSTREDVKRVYTKAINQASMRDLIRLGDLYAAEKAGI